jgi:hypothetical protein
LRRVVAGIAALLIAIPAIACINTFTTAIKEAQGTGNKVELARLTAQVESEWRQAPTLENTNDLAVAWVLTGKSGEGIQLLRDLEKRQPGSAIVAANLGTALELVGSDQEALLWIRESVRRDPDEHQGSEWVHVKILEAKLAMKRDPNWLRSHSVVGWRDGQQLLADARGLVRSPMDLIKPISYQLNERTQFVSAPDAVVGDLYLTLGDIAHSYPGAYADAWERDGEESSNYHSALHFGTVHEVRARRRMEDADDRIEASRPERQAAARRAQTAQQQAEKKAERQRQDDQRRAERRDEQLRRRQLAVWVFISLGVLLFVALVWRRRRSAA